MFELGLGNGRTYHHLLHTMPDREIYVFERAVASHPDSTPPDDRLILGDIRETLPGAVAQIGERPSLIHADLGGHNREKNLVFARMISPLIAPLLAKGGVMVSSDPMAFETLIEQPLPADAVPGRCFIYR